MSHMIPTLSPPRDAAPAGGYYYTPRHAAYLPRHRRPVIEVDGQIDYRFIDHASQAACTGGMVNEYGKRLLNCRSTRCPRHQAGNYAYAYARHATDSL